MDKDMGKENSIIKTEDFMMESGNKIKWMDMGSCITSQENWHMKAIGDKISFMGKGFCTTRPQIIFWNLLIIQICRMSDSPG